jgi:AcrR family transcriptional regulator
VRKRVTLTARDRLLAEAVDYIVTHGVSDLTLRDLAAGIRSSHRMLIYHFGSKEGLLVEVIKLVEQRQRAALAELEFDSALSATRDRLACNAAMEQYIRLGEAYVADRSSPPPR